MSAVSSIPDKSGFPLRSNQHPASSFIRYPVSGIQYHFAKHITGYGSIIFRQKRKFLSSRNIDLSCAKIDKEGLGVKDKQAVDIRRRALGLAIGIVD
jgi:hypothetical protein